MAMTGADRSIVKLTVLIAWFPAWSIAVTSSVWKPSLDTGVPEAKGNPSRRAFVLAGWASVAEKIGTTVVEVIWPSTTPAIWIIGAVRSIAK